MKIGFIGGSFNPPHTGHIELANVAKRHLNLDVVVFLVTPCNPFKSRFGLPSVSTRTSMLQNIIKNRHFKISLVETKFKTAESFHAVRFIKLKHHGDQTFFILGSDNLPHFHLWKNHQEILRSTNVVFVNRGGFNLHKIIAKSHISRNSYATIYGVTQAISSTQIREKTYYK